MADQGNKLAVPSLSDSLLKAGADNWGALELLADELDDAVFVVDRDQNVLFFNRAAEALTGFSRDEVVGQHCLKGIRCEHCLKSCGVFDRKQVRDVPLELFRKDGSTIPVQKSASVLTNADSEVVGAVEIIRMRGDESEGEAAAPAGLAGLDPSTWARLETLLTSLGRGFLILDASFLVVHASAGIAELLGRSPRELQRRPAASVLGDELFAPDSAFRTALEAGERREGWRAVATDAPEGPRALSVTGGPLLEGMDCDGEVAPAGRYLIMVRPEPRLQEIFAPSSDSTTFEGMVARSPAMRRVFALVEQLADTDASVLITGESGTGKELVARAVHNRSTRANHPFVAVNCGALPPDLLESELFGHARGSFTGAVRDKVGRFEAAGRGTILLDEIGDMPLPLQVKLLRVLQERTFERVGETRSREFRARVVAATHQDLARLVGLDRFRQDLFYRLNVVPIVLPPLRERREDLDVLITHLLEKIGQRRARAKRLSPAAMRALLSFDWPGNVRQLENALEYATAVCEGQTIHKEDLPAEILNPEVPELPAAPPPAESTTGTEPAADLHQESAVAATDAESPEASAPNPARRPLGPYPSAQEMVDALRQTRHRRGPAAKLLGVSRTTLWRRMREEGLLE
ncbi:MAG: sigma 54-interacting transcriptional regulator [Deltaproteobacteria bacterium]|nr:sigma 54-interacting transcriptional regulator [Deltaproteobacteria bacterium]MBW2530681.1 sigma 54-interacting transcriptional regulator [Deltaproteobacteria bacterium]